jgi:hypothetical protein
MGDKKRIEVIKVAAAKVVVNDYGKYCDEERKAGRTPKSKADWADMLVKNAKERRKNEEFAQTSVPTTGAMAAGVTRDEKPAKKAKPAKEAKEDKKAKKEIREGEMSVSDVARECGIEPKVARARLRKDGTRAPDGRWPTVVKGSPEHARLVALFKAEAKPAKKDEVKGDEVDDESGEE